MFAINQIPNGNIPGNYAPAYYVRYNQKEKKLTVDDIPVSSAVAFDVIYTIKALLTIEPEYGRHYDVSVIGHTIVIGMSNHNISVSKYDLPNIID